MIQMHEQKYNSFNKWRFTENNVKRMMLWHVQHVRFGGLY